MAITMLNENDLPKYILAEMVNTTCYVLNRVLLRLILKKTLYELWKNKKSNIDYFKVSNCKCFILNTKDNISKLDSKSNVESFLVTPFQTKALEFLTKRPWW